MTSSGTARSRRKSTIVVGVVSLALVVMLVTVGLFLFTGNPASLIKGGIVAVAIIGGAALLAAKA